MTSPTHLSSLLCKSGIVFLWVLVDPSSTTRPSSAFVTESLVLPRQPPLTALAASFNNHNHNGRNIPLPMEEYKKTAAALLDVLQQTQDLVTHVDALASHLVACQALDPDIADPENDDDDVDGHGDRRHGRSRWAQDLRRAVRATEEHGRCSPQAERAWRHLTRHATRDDHHHHRHDDDADDDDRHTALLSHPSYRYRYAQHLILQQQRQEKNQWLDHHSNDNPTTAPFVVRNQARTLSEAVQDLRHTLNGERTRLEDRELARGALLRTITGFDDDT